MQIYTEPNPVCESVHLHTVGLGQATASTVTRQKSVLKVNDSLSNLLIFRKHVMVIEHDFQVLLQRQCTRQLKHPEQKDTSLIHSPNPLS